MNLLELTKSKLSHFREKKRKTIRAQIDKRASKGMDNNVLYMELEDIEWEIRDLKRGKNFLEQRREK